MLAFLGSSVDVSFLSRDMLHVSSIFSSWEYVGEGVATAEAAYVKNASTFRSSPSAPYAQTPASFLSAEGYFCGFSSLL